MDEEGMKELLEAFKNSDGAQRLGICGIMR